MLAQYDIRPDAEGWTVFNIWTGLPAEVKGVVLIGADIEDADDLADLLSLRPDLDAALTF